MHLYLSLLNLECNLIWGFKGHQTGIESLGPRKLNFSSVHIMSSSGARSAGDHIASKIAGAAVRVRGPKPPKKPAKSGPNAGNKKSGSVAANAMKDAQAQEINQKVAPQKASRVRMLLKYAVVRRYERFLIFKTLADPFLPLMKQKPEDVIENAPKSMVLSLYKQLLRRSRSLSYTDKDFFARRMHQEFMKRKDVKDNNLYYIRGKWMLVNNMGGLL